MNIVLLTNPRSGSNYFAMQKLIPKYQLHLFADSYEPFSETSHSPKEVEGNLEKIVECNEQGNFFVIKIFANQYLNVLMRYGIDLIDLLDPYTEKFYVLVRKNIQENYNSTVASLHSGIYMKDRPPITISSPATILRTTFVPLTYIGLSHLYKNKIPENKSELIFFEDFATPENRYPNVPTCPEGWPRLNLDHTWVENLFLKNQ